MEHHERLTDHDVRLAKIEAHLEHVSESLRALSENMVSQQHLLSSFTRVENDTKHSVQRIHDRIDRIEGSVKNMRDDCDRFKRSIAPLTFFVRYPKAGLLMLSGLYVMTFAEVRAIIFSGISGP